MKSIFAINDNLPNKISYYFLLGILLSLPFDQFYSHLFLIGFFVHTLIHLKKTAFGKIPKAALWLQSVFLLTLLGIAYTPEKAAAWTELGRLTPVLLLPIFLPLNALALPAHRDRLLQAFALLCTGLVLYLYFEAFRVIHYYQFPLKGLFSEAFLNHHFSAPLAIHATYLSLQLAMAFMYVLYLLMTKANPPFWKRLYGFCCIILLAGIIQLASKAVCIALLLIVLFVFPLYFLKGSKRWTFIGISCTLTLGLCFALSTTGAFRDRFVEGLTNDLQEAKSVELTDPRWARWELALQLIQQAPIIGHGPGTEIPLLKDLYFEHHFYRSYVYRLNAHSQYLSFLIQFGALGLLVYLATLIFGLRHAFRHQDGLLLCFICLFGTVCLSENLFDAEKSIFFYSLFFSVLYYSGRKKEKTLPFRATKAPDIPYVL